MLHNRSTTREYNTNLFSTQLVIIPIYKLSSNHFIFLNNEIFRMISNQDNFKLNNSNTLKRKFSVENLLETVEEMPTIKRLKTSFNTPTKKSLKFGVESFILKDDNDFRSKFVANYEVVRPLSPNTSSLIASSGRSPSHSDSLLPYTSYIQPTYHASTACERCLPLIYKPLVSNDSCFYQMNMNNTTQTLTQQMMARISGFTNNNITEGIYTTNNSNINLFQSHYNNHYTQSNARNGDQSANHSGKRKKSWSRAVFSNLQRKGLEKRFQIQKYITKPDRRQLAATLGLTDSQVKVWFQNRRMKWRHSKEYREDLSKTNANKEQLTQSSINKAQETNET